MKRIIPRRTRQFIKRLLQPIIQLQRPASRAPDFIDMVNSVRSTFGETLANIRALGHRPGTVIDVGVAFGTPELVRAFPDSPLLMIEPLEEFRPCMEQIASLRPGTHFVVAAAGAADGETEMSVTPDKSTSSLRVFEGAERRKVPVIRLDTVCRQFNSAPPYALKVDVQGAELVVLEGASGILSETLVVVLEASFWAGGGAPDVFGVISYMKERGFVLYDIMGGAQPPSRLGTGTGGRSVCAGPRATPRR